MHGIYIYPEHTPSRPSLPDPSVKGYSFPGYSVAGYSLADPSVKGYSCAEWSRYRWSSNENPTPDYSLNRYSFPRYSVADYSFTKVTSGAERFFLAKLLRSREGKLLWSRVVSYL